ncbi:MAG: hypothetical protein IKN49_03805 [Elusimicrobiaceae bacterium]|nr:hypothetical protein [Elusimicrobiaceae bacterium]
MKKVIILTAVLLSMGAMGYAETLAMKGQGPKEVEEMLGLDSQTASDIATRKEKLALGMLALMTQDASHENELKIIGAKLRKITPKQLEALAQANTTVEYIILWLEPKMSSEKELFEVSLALRKIKAANDFLLQYGGEKSDGKLRVQALITMTRFHQSIQALKKLNGAIYNEVEYLLTDPRLPEIERDIFKCVDQGYKECYK